MSTIAEGVIDRAACEQLDRDDPLSGFRERFAVDDGVVYLDGNSLGRLPLATPRRVAELVEQEWGRGLVRSWTDSGWMDSPLRVGAKVARLVGAAAEEMLITDSTSVDLFKLASAVIEARPERQVILTEAENFPTDLYIAESVAALHDHAQVRRVPRSALRDALDESTALLMLTHVDFRTGEMHDMRALTDAAHAVGSWTLWDLSHSAGAVRVDLHGSGADLACGCGYKYLNGGPGAPAYLYVATRHQAALRNPIRGWLGHESPFTFEAEYRPAAGIRSWMSGSPPVIAIAALEVAVDMFLEAEMDRVAAKASALGDLFVRLVDTELKDAGFEVASPRSASRRGGQVSLRHDDGFAIVRALIARDVIGDFRAPNLCRFGFAPLYTRYVDVWDAVQQIAGVMRSGEWSRPEFAERTFIT